MSSHTKFFQGFSGLISATIKNENKQKKNSKHLMYLLMQN